MEKTFFEAVVPGKVDEVKEILRDNPTLDVNWKNDQFFGCTALHLACTKGFEAIVAILLAHPGIDVNEKAIHGATPFFWGCTGGHVSCFRLMLKDPRVLVNEPDNFGNTPLKNAVWWKNPDVIKRWVASGREMDLGEPGNGATDAIGGARKFNLREVLALLERFQENPAETSRQVLLNFQETSIGAPNCFVPPCSWISEGNHHWQVSEEALKNLAKIVTSS